jgi:hypothetical protein
MWGTLRTLPAHIAVRGYRIRHQASLSPSLVVDLALMLAKRPFQLKITTAVAMNMARPTRLCISSPRALLPLPWTRQEASSK